jgi:hypothetical protein
MSFLSNIFKASSPSAPAKPAPPPPPPPPSYSPIPAELPKIAAPKAVQIAEAASPSPEAQALLTPQQTPSQYLNALQEKHMGGEMVKTMAHGLPDREGVHWAASSAAKVSDKLPPDDLNAMKAAQAWVKSPTPSNQAAASAAAAATNFKGPGAFAAQGAAWAQPPASGGALPAAAAAPRLTPHAVNSAVMMSSSIQANPALAAPTAQLPTLAAPAAPAAPILVAPKLASVPPPTPTIPPDVQAQTFQQQHPFIKLGVDIASGKNSWA